MRRLGKKNAWERRGRHPKGRERRVGFLGRRAANPFPPSREYGERCNLPQRNVGHSPTRNRIWCILGLNLTSGGKNFNDFRENQSTDQISVNNTSCGAHSLKNMDYGQKSCLPLGIFIQCNSYLKKADTQNYASLRRQMGEIIV